VRLARLEQLRELVVALAQKGVEVVPGACCFLGGRDKTVIDPDEGEHYAYDRTEHEKAEEHLF
jgi:hypothetical protein